MTKIASLSSSESERDLLEATEYLRQQICQAFGVPPALILPKNRLYSYFEKVGWTEEREGTCPLCKREEVMIAVRRRGCSYVEDAVNWWVSCQLCQDEDDEHWKEMWEEYWAGRL